ncbi:hypothetical protein B1H19_35525 [Streptomyces gilvosporeus]|uniref:Uncharacterized protein n=2 Tax=Streptomyces gilvosporeus TaxID=553510 RepID=A0A1V0U0W4_9ACTN|nr:hypothetical protein B1H19_35525 [Streptomyces gilvosporeus]
MMDHLNGHWTPSGFRHDYSSRSATQLEKELIAYCPAEGGDDERQAILTDLTAAYFGEVLLNQAGGRWKWDNTAGELTDGAPVVVPDPSLGLEAIDPAVIARRALTKRTGRVVTGEVRRLRKAVGEYQKARPEWRPDRVPTPRVRDWDLESVRYADDVDQWRGECLRDFRQWWLEEVGGDRYAWVFNPASMDLMEKVLRERCASVEEFDAVSGERFWIVAAWYVGMAAVHGKGAVWQYRAVDPDAPEGGMYAADNYWTGSIFVNQRNHLDGHAAHPSAMLRGALEEGGSLRRELDRFKDPHPDR